uniref:Uncharacterized protein n=1 Tax=Populus trichocarpa TaxID=3694 RepID=A0A3N7FJH7_POPTR
MAIVSGLPKQFSGLVFPHDYKLPFGIQRCSNEVKFSDHGAVQLEFRREESNMFLPEVWMCQVKNEFDLKILRSSRWSCAAENCYARSLFLWRC